MSELGIEPFQRVLVEERPVRDDEEQDDESKDSIDDEHDLERSHEVADQESYGCSS